VTNHLGSLQTCDQEELVVQMLRLTGSAINLNTARFYLEANQWSLGAAVCSYFDHCSSSAASAPLPSMTLIKDVTLGEGEAVPPSTKFLKTWRVSNPGPSAWPPGCILRFTGGANLSTSDRVLVPWGPLEPGSSAELSVQMESPSVPGIYQSTWRMSTATGNFFGDAIWVIISVEVTGTLAITQQFSRMENLGSSREVDGCLNQYGRSIEISEASVDELSGRVKEVQME